MKTCTDCGAEIKADEMAAHMKDEHGVAYAIPEATCCCDDKPCARAAALEGR